MNVYGIDWDGDRATVVRMGARGMRRKAVPATLDDARRDPGARVAAALRQRESLLRPIRAPFADVAKARRVLLSILDVDLPFPVESCVVAEADLRAENGETRGWAALAREADVERALAVWRERGLDPERLDQESLALWAEAWRTLPRLRADAERLQVLVYAGSDRTTVVLGRAGRLVAAHGLGSGNGEAVVRLLKPQIVSGAVAWVFVGPAVQEAQGQALCAALTRAWPGVTLAPEAPEGFLARSLARRLAAVRGPYTCDFRTGPYAHPRERERLARREWVGLVTVAAAALVLIGVNVTWRVVTGHREAAAQAAISRLAAEISPAAVVKGQEVSSAKHAVEREDKRVSPVRMAGNTGTLDTLRVLLEVAGEQGIALESVRVRREGRLQATGVAPDWHHAEAAEQAWGAKGLDTRVDRREEWADGRVVIGVSAGGDRES